MTNVGKKLQNTYDTGTSKLAELKSLHRSTLDESTNKYLSGEKKIRLLAANQATDKQKDFDTEIAAFLSRSTSKIQAAIDTETRITNSYLKQLLQQLSFLSHNFEDSFKQLKTSQDIHRADFLEELSNKFSSIIDQALVNLRCTQNEISKNSRGLHNLSASNFESSSISSLAAIHEYRDQLLARGQSVIEEQIHNSSTYVDRLSKSLTAKLEKNLESLESELVSSDQKLKDCSQAILTQSEKSANDELQNLTNNFEQAFSQRDSEFEAELVKHKKCLQGILDSINTKFSTLAKNLKLEVENQGHDSCAAIEVKAHDIHHKADAAIEVLNSNLNNRLENSLKLQKELERSNNEISENIRNELITLVNSFKKKLEKAVSKNTGQLSKICNDAQQEIIKSQSNCESLLQSSLLTTKSEISSLLLQTLERVQLQRTQALGKIEQAVTSATMHLAESESINLPNKSQGNDE